MKRPLPADLWARVEAVFEAASRFPPDEREDYVNEVCSTDDELRLEVLSLIHHDTPDERTLFDALEAGAASVVHAEPIQGTLLGPYRIERELGRGGMAIVYLGARADGEFRKHVAIKLIRRGMDTSAVVERLRRERRILAALDHPYIARLLDGGTTSDGLPYIVMEYVEGVPIDRYCRDQGLNVEQRCRLMAKVCESVASAHRNLVIHRDLKPGNIMVGPDGNPKLLDFGIAKILSNDSEDPGGPLTRGPAVPRTPEYASPEQMNGGVVGTTADVYSLGVVLYELLAGVRPPDNDLKVSAGAARNGKGRKWQRRLEGDLDNILQVSLRTEPQRRYLSVEQFERDLRLHLAGMPVQAHGEGFFYRAGKFLRRHRVGAFAATLVAASLIAGLGATLWQARKAAAEKHIAETRELDAEREREIARHEAAVSVAAQRRAENEHAEADLQRAQAETERQRADRRFDQVRQMARKFLFDFHDSIATLTGSTPARKMTIDTGIRYYDSLLKEAGGNRDLLEEIARGYDRLGDVQGNPYSSNLGDIPGAEVSYRKALGIRDRISDPSADFLRDRVEGYLRMGEILIGRNDDAGSARYLRLAVDLGKDPGAAKSYEVRDALARAWSRLGDALSNDGAKEAAVEPYTRMLSERLELAPEAPDAAAAQRDIGIAHLKLAGVFNERGTPSESVQHLRAALPIFSKLWSADPSNIPMTRLLCVNYNNMSEAMLAGTGQDLAPADEVTSHLRTCSDMADKMVSADPDNRRALVDSEVSKIELGDWLHEQENLQEAASVWSLGMAAAQRLTVVSAAGASGNERYLAELHRRNAIAGVDSGRYEEALADLRRAEDYAAEVEKTNPESLMRTLLRNRIAGTRANLFMLQKRWQDAIGEFTTLISGDDSVAKKEPGNELASRERAESYFSLATCYAESAQRDAAVRSMRTAVDSWMAIAARRHLSSSEDQKWRAGVDRLAEWNSN